MRLVAPTALLAALLVPARASADDKATCIAAHAEGQTHRQAGHFEASRAALLTCSSEVCPPVVRKDCVEYLAELDRAQPSVIVTVVDRSGESTLGAAMSIDGKLHSSLIPPLAVRLDPGAHTISVQLQNYIREQNIVLSEGDRATRLVFRFDDPPSSAHEGRDARESSVHGGLPKAGWVFFGAAAAATVTGAVFGGLALSDGASLRESCGVTRSCERDDVDALHREARIADIAFGLGAAAAVAGIVIIAWPRSKVAAVAGHGIRLAF